MTKPLIQIGDEIREMTKAEHDQHLLDLAEWQAVLDKLGLTANEAQALLG